MNSHDKTVSIMDRSGTVLTSLECARPRSLAGEQESERHSATKPRVASSELPWEDVMWEFTTPTGWCLYPPCPTATTRLGLPISPFPVPRVARPSQPWAGGHNPFGIGNASQLLLGAAYRHRTATTSVPISILPQRLWLTALALASAAILTGCSGKA